MDKFLDGLKQMLSSGANSFGYTVCVLGVVSLGVLAIFLILRQSNGTEECHEEKEEEEKEDKHAHPKKIGLGRRLWQLTLLFVLAICAILFWELTMDDSVRSKFFVQNAPKTEAPEPEFGVRDKLKNFKVVKTEKKISWTKNPNALWIAINLYDKNDLLIGDSVIVSAKTDSYVDETVEEAHKVRAWYATPGGPSAPAEWKQKKTK